MLHAPRCSAAEAANTDFVSYLSATDCLDGDLTSQVKLSMNDSLYNPQPGDYPVTAQVSNSAEMSVRYRLRLRLRIMRTKV